MSEEKRYFTVHDREYLWTKAEMDEAIGPSSLEELEEIWKSGRPGDRRSK